MDIFSAIVLGIVQGATEFLPVSSTGHLVLIHSLLGVDNGNALAFDAILHLATASAVIVYFFEDIWALIQTLIRKMGRLPVNRRDMVLIKALLIGTIPAVVFGFFLEGLMETTFRSPLFVAGILVIGSIFFMYVEYQYQNSHNEKDIDTSTGFKIGLFQTLALLPGFSRSGASIAGGMLMGLSRTDATRFAFLLAVPIILGAGTKKCLELLTSDTEVAWTPIIIAAAVAFFVGLAAIHFMIRFVRTHTLWPFIWYRIVLAAFVVFVVFFG